MQRQWCGNTGKTDNCVVSVHIGCCDGDFQCLLDSDLYLPKVWANDPIRCEQAHVPEEVVCRKKTTIALDQIRKAIGNGIRVAAWTFDEWYGRDGSFLDGLDEMGQSYVAEVPANFTGWAHEPRMLHRPSPQQARKRGPKRRYPRLAKKALPASKVKNLVIYSHHFQNQPWQKFKIKDGEKGPVVWEAKHAPFFRKQGQSGLPGKPHTLVVARNVLNPDEVKYFVSDRAVGPGGTSLEWILWVAFSRWPIERCFELAKRDLGMDHFEVRNWQAIHRHLYISQLSLLFCSIVHQEYREKNGRNYVPDSRASSTGSQCMAQSPDLTTISPQTNIPPSSRPDSIPPTAQSTSSTKPHKTYSSATERNGHRSRSFTLVYGS